MKRQQDRDSPQRSGGRRGRNSYEGGRRDGHGRSGKMGREGKSHRDHSRYDMDSMERGGQRRYRDDEQFSGAGSSRREPRHHSGGESLPQGFMDFKTLCASNLNPSVPDDEIRDVLLHQFERFGNLNVKLVFNGDQRLAYLNFRSHDVAAEAKHIGKDMILFDKKIHLDPVYGKPVTTKGRRSASPGPPPPYGRERGGFNRSPSNYRRRSDYGGDFDRRGGGGFGGDMGGGFEPHPNHMSPPEFGGRTHKERFPHHLDHMNPEDDDRATRTLFVGNLDLNITEHGLRRIFERYGDVEEIDIKRPIKGQGNAYAFVKFFNLDMAHRAKVEMSGQFVGKFQCKIGYGKVAATACVWVGGLDPWTTLDTIEREFDRFGMIRRVCRPEGKSYAYVLYDNADAATAACQEMRGFQLPGQSRRIKTDYADIAHLNRQSSGRPSFDGDGPPPPDNFGPPRDSYADQWPDRDRGFDDNRRMGDQPGRNGNNWERGREFGGPQEQRFTRRDGGRFEGNGGRNGSRERQFGRPDDDRGYNRGRPGGERGSFRGYSPERNPDLDRHGNVRNLSPPPYKRTRHSPYRPGSSSDNFPPGGPGRASNNNGNHSPNYGNQNPQMRHSSSPGRDHLARSEERGAANEGKDTTLQAETVVELSNNLPVAWSGALVLKNSAFAARMHLVSGDAGIVEKIMRDPNSTEVPMLRITQRLRLDQPKLDEVTRQVTNAGPLGHAVLLAVPGSAQSVEDAPSDFQQRPLRNLVSYLKQKDAAGVIVQQTSGAGEKHNGVMHSFPPCQFGNNYLSKKAPKLTFANTDEEYLVIVVVTGSTV